MVGVEFTAGRHSGPVAEDSLTELAELAASAGARVCGSAVQRRPKPDAATLVGSGKLEELAALSRGCDLVIFDNEFTPTQQRNLERALDTRVLTRTQLILDIFARHARTREGQLQVELAQLEYLLPRLTGHGQAMSRLGGGIGTRGPGETKLETDRRRIHSRIRTLKLALERVRRQRAQQRSQRESVPLATVALVGYTNAGKSTLFNRLTGAEVVASPRMFATLDPTLRTLRLPSGRKVLLSDTVGFVSNLPHSLVSAFRATLEEVTRAALLLVVSDVAAPERTDQEKQVEAVLAELGVGAAPRIAVWNKADKLAEPPALPAGGPRPVLVSARTGLGLEKLLERLDAELPMDPLEEVHLRIPLHIPHLAGKLVHLVHERGQVLAEHHAGERVDLIARVPVSLLPQLAAYRARKHRPIVENR
ncbi:MAG TPA: GTPase HflX [Terriglobales bacterium]|nr:GTPase HflX [Terriglobales bacterium]